MKALSRKTQMDNLKVGESCVFIGNPGQPAQKLQASVAASYRGDKSMNQQGLTQEAGMLVFSGELVTPVTRITRFKLPE